MVMANIVLGVRRPSDIARNMGVSRQAIHATISQMIEVGIVALVDDPTSRRVKVVAPSVTGETMRVGAQQAMVLMTEELFKRLGKTNVLKAAHLLAEDWGPPLTFTPDEVKGRE